VAAVVELQQASGWAYQLRHGHLGAVAQWIHNTAAGAELLAFPANLTGFRRFVACCSNEIHIESLATNYRFTNTQFTEIFINISIPFFKQKQ
jgi:hypothetical protein